ncbi:MAG: XRE family transcriptional regulator [Proteobacteria bacterium]|nr:XRE family transcriptional regulator [Pseudomonadota bacterium]
MDQLTAVADPDAAVIGGQIRDLRKARGLTLETLAARIDRSVGYVSQVERGLSLLTIPNLKAIAQALGVGVNWFFQGDAPAPEGERGLIVRHENRRRLNFPGTGVSEELLSPGLSGAFEMILGRYKPGAESGDAKYARFGEEGGVVLEGELELILDTSTHRLRAGDAFTFPLATPHKSRNPTDRETVVLWVISPPSY